MTGLSHLDSNISGDNKQLIQHLGQLSNNQEVINELSGYSAIKSNTTHSFNRTVTYLKKLIFESSSSSPSSSSPPSSPRISQLEAAVNKLQRIAQSETHLLKDKEFVAGVCQVANKLMPDSTKIEDEQARIGVQAKISNIVKNITLENWEASAVPLKEIVDSTQLQETWRKELLFGTTVYLDDYSISETPTVFTDEETLREALAPALADPTKTTIQIKGSPPLPKSVLAICIKNKNISILDLFKGNYKYFIPSQSPQSSESSQPTQEEQISLNPHLIAKSRMIYQSFATSWVAESANKTVKLYDIDPHSFALINAHAEDFSTLPFEEEGTFKEMVALANYLDIPELQKICDGKIADQVKKDFNELKNSIKYDQHELFLETVKTIYQNYNALPSEDYPNTYDALQGYIQNWLDKPMNAENLQNIFKFLKENNIHITSLNLSAQNEIMNDALLENILKDQPLLISLDLSECGKLTDECRKSILKLKQLQSLNMSHCRQLTDAFGECLPHLTLLQSLNMSHCRQLGDGFGTHLIHLNQLQVLDMNRGDDRRIQISDRGGILTDVFGMYLVNLTKLRSINMQHQNELTDEFGAHLTNLTQLRSLNMNDCPRLTDAFGAHLVRCDQLESLELGSSYSNLTNAFGVYLVNFTHLQTLNMKGSKVTDAFGAYLSPLKQLQSLNMSLCALLTDDFGAHLADMNQLRSLKMSGCKKLTNTFGTHLTNLIQLLKLDMNDCDRLSDDFGRYLVKLRQLQSLSIGRQFGKQFTDAFGEHLIHLDQLQTLSIKSLKLTEAFGEYLTHLRQLQDLEIQGMTTLRTRAFENHLLQLPHLKKCSLSNLNMIFRWSENLRL